MSTNGLEARKRKNLVKRKRATMLPIRTNVWQALKAAGLMK
jgi:hypothetical protein